MHERYGNGSKLSLEKWRINPERKTWTLPRKLAFNVLDAGLVTPYDQGSVECSTKSVFRSDLLLTGADHALAASFGAHNIQPTSVCYPGSNWV